MPNLKLIKFLTGEGSVRTFSSDDIYDKSIAKSLADYISELISELDLLATSLDNYTSVTIVPNLAVRDSAKNVKSGDLFWVEDATSDSTVKSGGAAYIAKVSGNTIAWSKLAESESLDISLDWSQIQGTPSSSVSDIDDAVGKRHTHLNKLVLDKISQDENCNLVFNGQTLKKYTGIDSRASILTVGNFDSRIKIVTEEFDEDGVLPNHYSFIVSRVGVNVNFFENNPYPPPTENYDVYINGVKTDQSYTAISFSPNDHVEIKNNFDEYYPPFYGNAGSINIKSIDILPHYDWILPDYMNNESTIVNFSYRFSDYAFTTIPENLFYNNSDIYVFDNCFLNCVNLTFVPEELFVRNTKITKLNGCFKNCPNLKNFRIKITAPDVIAAYDFIPEGSGGTVLVPKNTTTESYFKGANISGLTVETY